MIGAGSAEKVAIISDFAELEVWKKAFSVSLDVHRASLKFPQIEQFALADQIRRASKSICANVAEGFSKQSASKPEFRRFLQMAMGSGNEMIVWIKYCRELGYIEEGVAAKWEDEYLSICKMLNALHFRS